MKNDKKQKSTVSKGLSLSVLTFGSRILGLIREQTKANFLGTGLYADAFQVAFQIPNLFRRLFAENSVSVAFIPTFKKYLEDSDTEDGKKTTQSFINATFTFLTFVTVLFVTIGAILAPLIIKIFYKDDISSQAFDETVILTRIMFPYLAVVSVAALFQGILNGLRIFSPSGFTPILFNGIVIIVTYLLANHGGLNAARAMSLGVLLGGIVQAVFQLPFVLKSGWTVGFTSLKKAFSNPGTRKVIRLVGPTILGMAGYQINELVSSALATRYAGQGVLSGLSYSLRLQELILGIFAVTIGTVILPDLTGFAKKQQWKDFNNMLKESIKIMTFIAVPVTFYSLVMGKNLITLLYASGKFDGKSIELTTNIFHFHIVGLLFIALNRIIAPSFYAQENTVYPTIAGLSNSAINIILAALLVGPMGGPGIALALSIASFANTVILFVFIKRNNNMDFGGILKSSLLYAFKMIVFSIIAALPVYLLKDRLNTIFAGYNRFITQGFTVLISAIIFGVIGIGLMIMTKDPLIKSVTNKMRKRSS